MFSSAVQKKYKLCTFEMNNRLDKIESEKYSSASIQMK